MKKMRGELKPTIARLIAMRRCMDGFSQIVSEKTLEQLKAARMVYRMKDRSYALTVRGERWLHDQLRLLVPAAWRGEKIREPSPPPTAAELDGAP